MCFSRPDGPSVFFGLAFFCRTFFEAYSTKVSGTQKWRVYCTLQRCFGGGETPLHKIRTNLIGEDSSIFRYLKCLLIHFIQWSISIFVRKSPKDRVV